MTLYSIYALVISMVIIAIFLLWSIVFTHMHHEGQPIREEGPRAHLKKARTPTMGGTVFVIASVIATTLVLVWKQSSNNIAAILIIALLGYGLVGFLDDGLRIIWKNNLGLRAWQKLLSQIFIAIVLVLVASFDRSAFVLRMPWGGVLTGPVILVLFTIFWSVGFSNAVNLSDGLGDLASGLSIASFATYAYLALKQENLTILAFCMSVIGGLTTFLIFDHKPAKIFTGDAGSPALGGPLAAIAILLNRSWPLLLVGLVFVCETASVTIQVTSFKLTHKRVFRMTPIHYHLELSGWNEWKVDAVSWLVQLIFSILYLIIWG